MARAAVWREGSDTRCDGRTMPTFFLRSSQYVHARCSLCFSDSAISAVAALAPVVPALPGAAAAMANQAESAI